MRKFYYALAILVLIIFSCEKPTVFPTEQNVVFKASQSSIGLKSSCDQPIAQYALIEIDGKTHQVGVFYLNDRIFTNSMKLSSGDHTLSQFILVNDANTPNDLGDDIIVMAAPEAGSHYASFVSKPMPFDFTVDAFFKTEISIELLCFEPNDFENFGFNWFTVDEINVREFCIEGCICVDDLDLFIGSLYEGQTTGLQYQMPAIFKVDVYRNDNLVIRYGNEDFLGENSPLCIKYPDYEGVVDNFKFEVWVLGVNGYELFETLTTTDDIPLQDIDLNNYMYFAFGGCDDTFTGCETAFAYDAEKAYCFTEISEITSNNWGWSNGTYVQSENNYTLQLYAGAGGCVISSAYLVGNLVLSYNNDGHVTVTYNLNAGYTFTDIHLYVGKSKYQVGNETVSPGQYPYKIEDANASNCTFILKEVFTGPIYIIAHAEVCKI